MSGRLIITGKKSFCPWAPKNVERVLRDERIERERSERETAAQRKWDAEYRIEKLRQNYTTNADDQKTDQALKRFNLFEHEEMSMMQSVNQSVVDKSTLGIMPVFLGGDEVERRKSAQDFYVKKYDMTKEKDDKLKASMDPMRAFQTHDEDVRSQPNKSALESTRVDTHSSIGKRNKDCTRSYQYESTDIKRAQRKIKKSKYRVHGRHDAVSQSSSNDLEHLKRRLMNRERMEMERETDIYSRKLKSS